MAPVPFAHYRAISITSTAAAAAAGTAREVRALAVELLDSPRQTESPPYSVHDLVRSVGFRSMVPRAVARASCRHPSGRG